MLHRKLTCNLLNNTYKFILANESNGNVVIHDENITIKTHPTAIYVLTATLLWQRNQCRLALCLHLQALPS